MIEERPASPERYLYLAAAILLGVSLGLAPTLQRDAAASMVTQVVLATMLLLSWLDLTTLRIPNALVYPAIAFALVGTALVDSTLLGEAAMGAGVCLGIMFLLALGGRGTMGMGDVKFAALAGSILGWKGGIAALLFGFTLGAVVAILLLVLRIRDLKDSLPLTPFLGLGVLASGYLFGFLL
jgi:leader peptidase (prepilin peptidase)/N-methyltransferase